MAKHPTPIATANPPAAASGWRFFLFMELTDITVMFGRTKCANLPMIFGAFVVVSFVENQLTELGRVAKLRESGNSSVAESGPLRLKGVLPSARGLVSAWAIIYWAYGPLELTSFWGCWIEYGRVLRLADDTATVRGKAEVARRRRDGGRVRHN